MSSVQSRQQAAGIVETCPVMVPDYAVVSVYYPTQHSHVPCARAFLAGEEEDFVEFRNVSDPAVTPYTPIQMCAVARRLWRERQMRRIERWKREQEARKG